MIDLFTSIKHVCGLKVRIEKFKSPCGPPQCHRCQHFGHVDKAMSHVSKMCKVWSGPLNSRVQKNILRTSHCANCKGNHSANYRSCPVYQTLKNKIKILKEKARLKLNVNRFFSPKSRPCVNSPSFPNINPAQNRQSYAKVAQQDLVLEGINKIKDSLRNNPSVTSENNSNVFTPPMTNTPANDWRAKLWIINLAKLLINNEVNKASFLYFVIESTQNFLEQ